MMNDESLVFKLTHLVLVESVMSTLAVIGCCM